MATRKRRKSTAPELPPTGKKVRVKRKTAQQVKGLTFVMALLFGLTVVFLFQTGDLKAPKITIQMPENIEFGSAVLLKDTYLRKNMQQEAIALVDVNLGQEVEVLGRDEAWVFVKVDQQKGYLPIESLLIEQ